MRRRHGLPLALLVALGACRSQPGAPLDPGTPEPPLADIVAGRAAFTSVCAACHSSRDGFDLAFFGFPDSTIVRRAVFHVDSAVAQDIAAHVRTLGSAGASRTARIFQPGGVILAGDVAFATSLFGADAWPADMTSERLLAIDPLGVEVAVPFPRWSVEFDNVDWMPDQPLPAAFLDGRGGAPRRALERYYGMPTLENLLLAIGALRAADRDPLGSAPCARIGEEGPLADEAACFEVRRWTATLAGQHMLRLGATGRVHALLHDTWWDVGNAARLATRFGGEVDNGTANWASWMLLGWVFEPERHASVYTGNGLLELDLPRHATFVALRSQVARVPGSEAPYADAASAARFAPPHWTYEATRFAFDHLLGRLGSGERPAAGEPLEMARLHVQQAYTAAALKVTPAQRAELTRLRDQILAALS
jgi:hypothetical protein